MNHLIIGCGYLGRRVASLWQAQGHRVWATTRKPQTAELFRSQGIEPILCDVLEPGELERQAAFDTVLYAVGLDRSAGVGMREVYVEGLSRVVEHLPPPRQFIYVSSSSVYGQADGSWVDEDSPTQPEEEAGQIVLEAETVLRRRLPAAIILRFAGIYGPGRLLRQKTIEASEPIVGNPEKWLNLIHVDDGASAILAVQQRAASGSLFNVCDGVPVMRRDFFAELARLLRAPPPRFAPPEGPVPHERGQRRIGNGKIMAETGLVVRYPSYREGLRAAVVSDAS